MVNPGRVLVVARRELVHRTNLGVVGLCLAVLVAMALFGLGEGGPRGFATAALFVLPTLFCPLAASRVAADRERGGRRVDATSPLTPTEGLIGRALGWIVLLALSVLAILPALYAFTEPLAPGAFAAAAPLAAGAFAVGLAAMLAGFLAGELTDGGATSGLSVGFGLAVAWWLVAAQQGRLLELANEGPQGVLVEALVKADPIVWGLAMQHPAAIAPGPEAGAVMSSLLTMSAWLGLLAVVVAWPRDRLPLIPQTGRSARWALPGAAGAGFLVTLLIVPLPAGPQPPIPGPGTGTADGFEVSLETAAEGAWQGTAPLSLILDVTGPREETIRLESLELASPHAELTHGFATPRELTLDEPTHGDRWLARTDGEGRATPTRIATAYPIELTATIDGRTVTSQALLSVTEWDTPTAGALAAALAPSLATGATIAWGLPRWNRW